MAAVKTLDNYLIKKDDAESIVTKNDADSIYQDKIKYLIKIADIKKTLNSILIEKDSNEAIYNCSVKHKLNLPFGVYIDDKFRCLIFYYDNKITEISIHDNIRTKAFDTSKNTMYNLYGKFLASLYAFDEMDVEQNNLNLKISETKIKEKDKITGSYRTVLKKIKGMIEIPLIHKINEGLIDNVLMDPFADI